MLICNGKIVNLSDETNPLSQKVLERVKDLNKVFGLKSKENVLLRYNPSLIKVTRVTDPEGNTQNQIIKPQSIGLPLTYMSIGDTGSEKWTYCESYEIDERSGQIGRKFPSKIKVEDNYTISRNNKELLYLLYSFCPLIDNSLAANPKIQPLFHFDMPEKDMKELINNDRERIVIESMTMLGADRGGLPMPTIRKIACAFGIPNYSEEDAETLRYKLKTKVLSLQDGLSKLTEIAEQTEKEEKAVNDSGITIASKTKVEMDINKSNALGLIKATENAWYTLDSEGNKADAICDINGDAIQSLVIFYRTDGLAYKALLERIAMAEAKIAETKVSAGKGRPKKVEAE